MCFTGSESPVVVVLSGSMELVFEGYVASSFLYRHFFFGLRLNTPVVVLLLDREIFCFFTWGKLQFELEKSWSFTLM